MKVQYDSSGRMKYHPDYHFNHKQPYTVNEMIYICSTYCRGRRREVAFAVGRTEATVASLVHMLKKSGDFDRYKEMNKKR
ncbi:DNA-entry nuclease [Bacillus sp. FSL R10-2789]|uniref:DNA-entry nuclease n=1 Tax=Bacillus sp. FSL R10-2789 TaxID=2954662 RepID=UPI0030FC54B9